MIFIKVQQSYTCFQKNNKNVSFKRTEHQKQIFYREKLCMETDNFMLKKNITRANN